MGETFNDCNFQLGQWLATPPPGEEVVITGMSGRLPKSKNIQEYCDRLYKKEEMVTENDPKWHLRYPEVPQRSAKTYDVDKCDAGYFGLHYKQANSMDPMIRLLLETSVEAVMDAGINPADLEGTKTGVFVNICWSDSETDNLSTLIKPDTYGLTGLFRCFFAHRISHFLKLKNQSFIADTACSSYLYALDRAFKAIRSGECENAIIGASNLVLHPYNSLQFFNLGILSPDGICRVFDENSNGYVRAETVACMFLQKAKNSKRIYAKVVNIKTSFDGYKNDGITFPSSVQQSKLLKEIYEESNITPDMISYVEAHGTGTKAGDFQEVTGLDCGLAKFRTKPLLIGSVKSNSGHSEAASGASALIKVLLAMKTNNIAPNINLKKLRTEIEGFKSGRIKVLTEITKLEEEDAIIGVNNFGYGGANCHVILQGYTKKKNDSVLPTDDSPRLVCVSGRTQEAVQKFLNDIQSKEFNVEYVALLHQVFKRNIKRHLYRGYTIISKTGTIHSSTNFYSTPKSRFYVFFGKFVDNFSLLGQYLLQFGIFKNIILRINKILASNKVKLFENVLRNEIKNDEKILGSICVQIGVVELLKQLEIVPVAVYGDSYGKLIFSYYHNVSTLEETIVKAIKLSQQGVKSNGYLAEDILTKPSKETCILNISDEHLNKFDKLLVESKVVVFLEFLGSLFEQGHNPQIQKLYPEIQWPVSKQTPMISPSIRWNHKKSWYTYKLQELLSSESQQTEHLVSTYKENKYIEGHVIDGRNLLPASEYLKLVWKTFADTKGMLANDLPVVFTNCKFIRATTMSEGTIVKLYVSLQRGTGNFEVVENNIPVATGCIQEFTSDIEMPTLDLKNVTTGDINNKEMLQQDDLYKELNLRGYNYSGNFRGVQTCSIDASTALMKWEDNWTTFLDSMLQLKIFETDSRLLLVPIVIRKLVIHPREHLKYVKTITEETNCNEEVNLPVFSYKNCNTIKSGGIEISGLEIKSISKKKQRLDPLLEKYQFVPNYFSFSLSEAIRINVQIILENSLESSFTAVEILDNSEIFEEKYLLPSMAKALEDIPSVSPDLTILSKDKFEEIPGVKCELVILTPESNLLLIVANQISQNPNKLKQLLASVRENGFILIRETSCHKFEEFENVEIVTEYTVPDAKLFLIRKTEENIEIPEVVEVSSENWDWIPELQKTLEYNPNLILYSKNQNDTGLLGFTNCIRQEPNGHSVKCFVMMDECPSFDLKNSFYSKQFQKNLQINVYKNKTWGTYRHLPLRESSLINTTRCFAKVANIGDISSFKWLEDKLPEKKSLSENQTLVYTYFAGLNFKDVMAASGRINIESLIDSRLEEERFLGFECVGKDLNGRSVCSFVKNQAFTTSVLVQRDFIWNIPEGWSLEDAATIPAAYGTVMYSFFMLGDLKPGSSVLIHSATGGVGLAALNVCTYYNCDIYVTVGTQEKREYLRKHYPHIPESHIGNSHDTSFEKMIQSKTKNQGVNFVLNSLAQDKLKASIRCLAKGGTFLEIGRFDLANDASFELLLMKRNASYHGIMLDQIILKSNKKKANLIALMEDGMKAGFIKPLPRVIFERTEIEKAFRYMMTGKHIGKILLKIRDEQNTDIPPEKVLFDAYPRFCCDPDYSYIILGGLGGFGLELADWLVLRGAKKLVLVSRSGIQNAYQKHRIGLWKSYNVNVIVSTKNITTKQGCTDLIKDAQDLGRVDAIFNLSVVLKDAIFQNQTKNSFIESYGPKAQATIYLDQITRQLCPHLRYFVVFSSVSCGRGNAGQTNYGMANSVMERICERRKQEGLPGLAIQWGAIGDVGLVASMQKENKELVIGGTLQQKISNCLQVLDKFLTQDHPIVSSIVVAEKYDKNNGPRNAVEAVAYILEIQNLEAINQETPLAELGLDSLIGTEVIKKLEKDFGIFVTAKEVRNLTFAKLAEIETEKSKEDKHIPQVQKKTNMLIHYIPSGKTSLLPMSNLNNFIGNNENISTVFLLPGIEGIFNPFEVLLKKVKANIFGIHYNCKSNLGKSVEEIALNILPNMEEKITKEIPFVIIGYSFGALITLQLVSLLEEKGYKGKIILIDGSPSFSKTYANELFPHKSEDELQTAFLLKISSLILPLDTLQLHEKNIRNSNNLEDRINLIISLIPQDVTNKVDLQKESLVALFERCKAILTYEFTKPKINSDVFLMKAKYSSFAYEDYQLSQFCRKPIQITTIKGDHASMLNEEDLFKMINNILI